MAMGRPHLSQRCLQVLTTWRQADAICYYPGSSSPGSPASRHSASDSPSCPGPQNWLRLEVVSRPGVRHSRDDVHFREGVGGFGDGGFFRGCFLLEMHGAPMLGRWRARRWIERIMMSWVFMTVLMAFIPTARQFYGVRFLVGAAEAGFLPGVIVYLTHWFRYEDRAKAVAFFYAANPLSYVIGSPLAGLMLGLSRLRSRWWLWPF